MHSTASDGSDPPRALPQLARAAGLHAIALTDHDTAVGLHECADACRKHKITFVPGIELSADPAAVRPDRQPTGTLHLLGYFIDPDSPALSEAELHLREARKNRNQRVVERLRELGVNVTYEQVLEQAGGQIVGRPHIARVLIDKGYVRSTHEAFERYLGQRGAAYVHRDRLSPAQAIELIHRAGGIAVLAHPIQLHLEEPEQLDHAMAKLIDLGLDGLEVRHSDHDGSAIRRYQSMAERRNLLITGGSDYHGSQKQVQIASQGLDRAGFERLCDVVKRRTKAEH